MNKATRAILIAEFEQWMNIEGYEFNKEVSFKDIMDTQRKFRADYHVYKTEHLFIRTIIEINGGQWTQGRHNRGGKGYESDLTKSNIANKNGFEYYQFTYEMLAKQEYKDYL